MEKKETFEPYTGICPIEGQTITEISQEGETYTVHSDTSKLRRGVFNSAKGAITYYNLEWLNDDS